MKLKTSFFEGAKHSNTVTAISWSNNEEIYSCGDDHALMKWNFLLNEAVKVSQLPDDFFPISLHWFPKSGGSARKSGSDLLLAASADGKFHCLNKNGRFERSIDAHQGAVLVALWSYDGAGLLTAGEDGQVKIWSRSGMLRSTVVTGDVPVYTAAWGSDSNQILVAQGRTLLLKPLTPNSKPIRWRAHEGVILKVAWNQRNNLIVSAGEDCRYKVWDSFGRALYASSLHDHPIASVAWSPLGDLFAVASFNTLRLCDRLGWSHYLEKVRTGTIYELAWSPDGTQLAGACGNGLIIFAHVIERRAEWKNFEVTVHDREALTVRNVLNDTEDKLEFGERIAQMALGYDHLVVTTSLQCYIYSTSNWNTPIIIQLRDVSANHIALTSRYFSLVERSSLNIYGYDGKLFWSPKLPGIEMGAMDSSCMSLSPDTLAVIDQSDPKTLHLIDLTSNRQTTAMTPIRHSQAIIQVALNQTGLGADRIVAFLDQTRDVFLAALRSRDARRPGKLGTMVSCIAWDADASLLAAVRDSILTVWCCPQALYFDYHLLRQTTFSRDISEMGKGATLVSFCGNIVTLRRSDGSLVSQSIPPYLAGLHQMVSDNKWEDVLRLCRFVNDDLLWSCLACFSSIQKELAIAEEAFAVINEFDKVAFIQHIKSLPLQPVRSAHLALLSGNVAEAESILLSNGLIFRAIMLLIATYNWTRALDLAIKHRTHVDTVLYKRKLYLEGFDKSETNENFLSYAKEVELDPEAIDEKIKEALVKEKEIV